MYRGTRLEWQQFSHLKYCKLEDKGTTSAKYGKDQSLIKKKQKISLHMRESKSDFFKAFFEFLYKTLLYIFAFIFLKSLEERPYIKYLCCKYH